MMKLLLLTVVSLGLAHASLDGIGLMTSIMDMNVKTFFNVIPSPFSSPMLNLTLDPADSNMMYLGQAQGGPTGVVTANGTNVYFTGMDSGFLVKLPMTTNQSLAVMAMGTGGYVWNTDAGLDATVSVRKLPNLPCSNTMCMGGQ